MKRLIMNLLAVLATTSLMAQSDSLSRHDFLYAGQSKQLRMYIVKNGKVDWYHNATNLRGEISDAILMSDGHILIAHQYGIAEMTQVHQTVWSYAAPEGTEIHTIQPIGKNHVVFVQNGHPAKVRVMEIPQCRIVHEFEIPASKGVHGQFRNARLSSRGTLLVCHMSQGYVAEYSVQGNELYRWELPGAWSVTELAKENLLMVGKGNTVKEITREDAQVVWQPDLSGIGLRQIQKAVRLKNGNTILNSWWNEWGKEPLDTLHAPLQAVEVDKDGKVVWKLCSWKNPDLGPATTIQPLDQSVDRNRLFFGHFNGRELPPLMVNP